MATPGEAACQDGQERAVGIAAFVSLNVPGFLSTVKQRYTDFLVNEILPNGEVLHLVDTRARQEGKSGPAQSKDEVNAEKREGNGEAIPDSEIAAKHVSLKRHADEDQIGAGAESTHKKQKVGDETGADSRTIPNGTSDSATEAKDDSTTPSLKERKDEVIASFPETDKATLESMFGTSTTAKILNLYASVVLNPGRKPRDHPSVTSEPITEKSKRTEAHVAIRKIFASKLETATIQDPNQPSVIYIKAAPPKGPSGARGGNPPAENGAFQKGKLGWQGLGGEYLHFTLYKENKDTMEALSFIASQLKVPAKDFQFAGTKDRRGVTVQKVAIFRVHADRIAKLNKTARGWRAGGFEYKKHGLELGESGGNEFLLTLRDVRCKGDESLVFEQRMNLARKVVGNAADSFGEKGFLNYYGLQRFGTFSTGTHMIGRKMLQGDLEGAVNSLLAYSEQILPENQDMNDPQRKVPQDDIDRADAIKTWRDTNKSHSAISKMPKRFQAEAAIMQWLGKRERKTGKLMQDRDWQGALMQIQRNLRLMYAHAYQSFVWNTVAGKRWEVYGDKVVEGDLVIVGEKDADTGPAKDEVDEDGEPIFHPTADDSAPSAGVAFTRARPLSKQETESGKYDIFDVVLPLPGFDVLYPSNAIGKFYEEFMASDAGGGLDPYQMRRAWKDISLSGSYRKVMAKPAKASIEWEVREYQGEQQLVETDLERLVKKQDESEKAEQNGATLEQGSKEGQKAERKIAVVLKMQLGSSQYATMALRELTKGGAANYKPDYSAR